VVRGADVVVVDVVVVVVVVVVVGVTRPGMGSATTLAAMTIVPAVAPTAVVSSRRIMAPIMSAATGRGNRAIRHPEPPASPTTS
jgi:hypothetical protein